MSFTTRASPSRPHPRSTPPCSINESVRDCHLSLLKYWLALISPTLLELEKALQQRVYPAYGLSNWSCKTDNAMHIPLYEAI